MQNKKSNPVFELILAALFISTSGPLGHYINMPPPVTIWWRSLLAAFFLYLFTRFKKISLKIESKKDLGGFILSSLILGAHWITYFYALQLSNVAIGMLSLYTYPIMITLLEPLFFSVKRSKMHILMGFIVLAGIYILAPKFDLENTHIKGLLIGLLSAFLFALRVLLLKQYSNKYHGTSLMFYQIFILSIVLLPSLFLMNTSGITSQYPYVILLALFTTAIGHTMFLLSLKHFSASTASIIASIQPLFGIAIAFFFLNEIPTWNTFWGGALILSTVIIESIRSKKES